MKKKIKENKFFEIVGKITTMIIFSSIFGLLLAYGLMNCTILN